ncbi:MAG TPA: sulfocyanin-like copper-binding protein [Gemmatimonadales bacterium]|nr:sulfocyanin-like copper-binding protein [Gemmatimonadales bacterium]
MFFRSKRNRPPERRELRKVQTTLFPDQTTTMIELPRVLHIPVTAVVLSVVIACSGRSPAAAIDPVPTQSSPAAAPATPADTAASPPWIVVDSAARVVTLSLEVTAPPEAPSALINSYRAGEARIVVPLGWTVKWDWRSADSTAPHSLVVMVQREKIPQEGGRASLSNAMTRMVVEGLRSGQNDQTTFAADEAGWYWLLCGVPGHGIKGEWLELRVDPEAKLPSVVVRKKA